MKTQFEVNEDFRVMENEELVYMLTKKNDFSQKAAEDLLENIKSLDPLLYSKLTHQKNIRIK